ncbi:hypothetical protein RZS08_43545, partial [Arthrospira platensis SPKY1]|nr:hypothetical protein [Arthrospira platensis SPKY1]
MGLQRPGSPSAGHRWRHTCQPDVWGSAWQVGVAHQVFVHGARRLATLANRPDDQRLATAHVAGGEHFVDAGG